MNLIMQQGIQYRIDKNKTYRIIQPNLSLIENFESREVEDLNKKEHNQLEYMQHNYNMLSERLSQQYKKILTYIKDPDFKKCRETCLTKGDTDSKSACLYGCNIGKFANSTVDQRITAGKPVDEIASDVEALMIATLGFGFGEAALKHNLHVEDDLSPSVHPQDVGAVIVEHFDVKANAAKSIGLSQGLGRPSYSTRKWDGINAPHTTAGGQDYNQVKYTDNSSCNADYGSLNAPTGVKLKACPHPGEMCMGVNPDSWFGPWFLGDGSCRSTPEMGAYGPDRLNGTGNKVAGDMINTALASDPEYGSKYYFDTKTNAGGYEVEETVNNLTSANNVNPQGMSTINYNAIAELALQTSNNFKNQTVVKQMEATNVDSKTFDKYLNQMRVTWRNMFISSCKAGIGGFGNTGLNNNIDTGEFSGYTQYCKSWVNTKENRSGYYSKTGVDAKGNITPLKSTTIELKNVTTSDVTGEPMLGCDAPILSERVDDNVVGGSGYCICADGSPKGYADSGHPVFTCNEVCSPENKDMSPLLYHNSASWLAPPGFSYSKWTPGNIRYDTKKKNLGANRVYAEANNTTGRSCGTFNIDRSIAPKDKKIEGAYEYNYDAVNDPPECPTGMTQDGPVKLSVYCESSLQVDKVRDGIGIDTGVLNSKDQTYAQGYQRKCIYKPPGFAVKPVNSIDKIIPMPTKMELLNSCSNVRYENVFLDILKLKLLTFLINKKASIIYKTIKESYSGSRATVLKQSELGKQILKNMTKYEKIYNKLRSDVNSQGLISALLEDVGLKKGSNYISYYMWFTLALGASALALNRFNS